jgi:peptide chain release factor subunit 1
MNTSNCLNSESSNETHYKNYRTKCLIRELENKKGNGTSLITISIGKDDSVINMRKKLQDEEGKAKNIKTRLTRQNAQEALVSAMEKLKLFKKTPENGLLIFSGITDTAEKIKLCF